MFQTAARSLQGLDPLAVFKRRLFCLPASALGAGRSLLRVPCSSSRGPHFCPLGTGMRRSAERTSPHPLCWATWAFSFPLCPSDSCETLWTSLKIYQAIPCSERAFLLVVQGERGLVPMWEVPREGIRQEPNGWGQSPWSISNESQGSGTEGPC